jgi:hypothetical protein
MQSSAERWAMHEHRAWQRVALTHRSAAALAPDTGGGTRHIYVAAMAHLGNYRLTLNLRIFSDSPNLTRRSTSERDAGAADRYVGR